ncbi:enolase [Sulfobacillus thermosulfidooxidans DSM 9293]|uniref:Enolase n=1 Tax=Sulfobacillus thermosulfidooxidans (strain DSM 9293 / VKM B-1269 / AT-1) TaxID=929705 RepID=A0A1W1W7S0_SULTA|nr:phosphopyruvate hydratase [Sulfobacillus thermosulfidooxidans]SMC02242.1 enolase [Sulfobacillus thermosulfidooxidans DSM 9293]
MPHAAIADVHAYQILDSRADATLFVEVTLDTGHKGGAAVPHGASTGRYEAQEIRDQSGLYRRGDVMRAVHVVNHLIRPVILGLDPEQQDDIDHQLIGGDGTASKHRWGANSILGVSLAVSAAAATYRNLPAYAYLNSHYSPGLPIPQMNVINGGVHADTKMPIQEFLLIPGGADSMQEAVAMGVDTYTVLKEILHQQGYRTTVGDEGGFAPEFADPREVFELLILSIERAGYRPLRDIALGIDVAASELFQNGRYAWYGHEVTAQELIDQYETWVRDYPLISIEDGLSEDAWSDWAELMREMPKHVNIVGDDIFVTNKERVMRGIQESAASAVLIKLNQIGTLTETREVIAMTHDAGWDAIVSHRSGETCDTMMVDLAIADGVRFIKAGAPQRGERVAKYNRLLLIEAMDSSLPFAGWDSERVKEQ